MARVHAKQQRGAWAQAARRQRPVHRPLHDAVDVAVVPHVDRARGARAEGDAGDRRTSPIDRIVTGIGASSMPTSAVNTTSDITLGFSRMA